MMLSSSKPSRVSWQAQLKNAFTRPEALLRYLELSPHAVSFKSDACREFAFRVPHYFAQLMRKADPHDPLLLQVLPQAAELQPQSGYHRDPLQDCQAHQQFGLLQKYQGRALLILTGSCAIHCRYCFRRHFPYSRFRPGHTQWQALFETLRARTDLHELILSGGDPLNLSNARLHELFEHLQTLSHLRRLRIHSRTPVVLPARMDAGLLKILTELNKPLTLVLHINHPREITPTLAHALTPLRHSGITLLNQAVLLRNINDQARTQIELCERLHEIGILPYYLHLLDKVEGAAHFDVSKARARAIYRQMQIQLPGYLLPRLVRERPNQPSKQLVEVTMS